MFDADPVDRSRARWAAIAAAFAVAAGMLVLFSGAFDSVERESRSLRFELRQAPRTDDITVVAIDEPTFSKLDKQWPFKRSVHAHLIDMLRRAGAREIVYDVQFTEPTTLKEDGALIAAVRRAGNVVLATGQMDDHGHTGVLGGDANLRAMHARAGAANLEADPGGTITRFPYEVSRLKTLGVVAAERAGRALDPGRFGHSGAWIDYRGAPGTFPTLSFADVLRGRFDRSRVAGRIVVIGMSDPTLQDLHATPTSGSDLMAGPEIQANAIATALDGIPLRSAPRPVDVLLVLLLGIAIPLAGLWLPMLRAAGLVPVLAAAFAVTAQLAFDHGWMVTVVPSLAALLAGAVAMVVVSYLTESRERERVARQKDLLEHLVRTRTEEVRETQLEVIWRLSQMAESRDEDTGLHIERISALSQAIALEIGLPPSDAEMIGHAAALHDVGKIGVPDRVLLKPGKLDPDEFEIMKTHTTVGANVLSGSSSPLLQTAEQIARAHHERWDGDGYPAGLAGAEIPLAARICSVCDVFDALMSKRVYKEAWGLDDALAELIDGAGTQFDPALVEAFVRIAPDAYEELKRQQAMRRLGEKGTGPQLIGLHPPARAAADLEPALR
ncbi:MAG TPA: CHASE2 domain-containing protein [Thermoleophilaceae bacterium]|jgi:HD-GYP domain-containing protein (c-di-GMP phosphodiesterase class II)|nr:CHASE2 domain-containing protein [Thermoleophilaceae bacterium]